MEVYIHQNPPRYKTAVSSRDRREAKSGGVFDCIHSVAARSFDGARTRARGETERHFHFSLERPIPARTLCLGREYRRWRVSVESTASTRSPLAAKATYEGDVRGRRLSGLRSPGRHRSLWPSRIIQLGHCCGDNSPTGHVPTARRSESSRSYLSSVIVHFSAIIIFF